jgi:hypothetical protein
MNARVRRGLDGHRVPGPGDTSPTSARGLNFGDTAGEADRVGARLTVRTQSPV